MPRSDGPGSLAELRRLHPASILFEIWATAKYLIPTGLFFWFSGGRGWGLWALLLLIPVSIGAVVQHLRYRYRLTGDELIILTGILGRYERHIPFHRIQDIRLIQNPVHRMLGVAEVKVETASGSKAEASMRALAVPVVEEIRRRVFEGEGSQEVRREEEETVPDSPGAREIIRFTLWDTVKAGLTQGRGWIVVGAAMGLAWEAGELFGVPGLSEIGLKRIFGEAVSVAFISLPGLLKLLLVIPAFVILLRLLSVAWALVRLHRFSLTKTGDDYRLTTGLFTRISATIPTQRLQAVRVTETMLQRAFNLVSVRARTAGGGGDEESDTTHRWLAPSLERHKLGAFLSDLVPTVDLSRLRWSGVHSGARGRILRRWLILLCLPALASLINVFFHGWKGFLLLAVPLVLLPMAFVDARRGAAALGYAMTSQAVVLRQGWWWRRIYAVEAGRIQSVTVRQSPFDRRYGMAALAIDTAGGGGSEGRLQLPYLPLAVAQEIRSELVRKVASTRFVWTSRA